MNRERTKSDYAARITRVVDYIYDNLDGDLSAERLSEVANFSTFHWHRIFHAMTGNTVAETVRRLRLHRAASDLLDGQHPIETTAKRAGYASVEAFSRAFRQAYGQPPAAFRNQRAATYQPQLTNQNGNDMHDVRIKTIDPIELATLPHRGPYMEIGRTFEKLCMQAATAGLFNGTTKLAGVYYDDPTVVAPADLNSAAGITVSTDKLPAGSGLTPLRIEGGRHAVLRHVGPYADLGKAYEWLFGEWLPGSGEEAAERPCFEIYLNDPSKTPPAELQTDIYLPLK